MTGNEIEYIKEAHQNMQLAGDGPFTKKCETRIESLFGTKRALLTHSCTAALEMAAILVNVTQGDEIIMPSFTFVSTANAFLLRGGMPRFVDIRPDTLNIDESKIEGAITEKTRAIVPVHYAGISCEMDIITDIAKRHNIFVIEDAAQAILSSYKGRSLGGIGEIAALSFHETKNVISGEGGAILLNRDEHIARAEIIREKGTNRNSFHRGEVDKYTWWDIGSSYLPGELIAAFLYAQLEEVVAITDRRHTLFDSYMSGLSNLQDRGFIRLPVIPPDCTGNGHLFYIIVENEGARDALIEHLKENGVVTVFHYIPLHLSPMGKKLGYNKGDFPITEDLSPRLLRLPLFFELKETELDYVVCCIADFFQVKL